MRGVLAMRRPTPFYWWRHLTADLSDMTTNTTTWATLEDAAAALGISVRTVQRRVAAGVLPAEKGADGRVLVRLPDDTDSPTAIVGAMMKQHDTTLQMSSLLSDAHAVLGRRYDDLTTAHHQLQRDLDRTRRRGWMAGTAALVLGVVAVASVGTMAVLVGAADRQTDAAQRAAVDAQTRADALQSLTTTMQVDLVQTTAAAALSSAEVRHLTDRLAAAAAERDRLAAELRLVQCEVADLRTDLLLGSVVYSGTPVGY